MLCKVQYSTKSPHLQGLICTSVHPFSLIVPNEWMNLAFFRGVPLQIVWLETDLLVIFITRNVI